jgi:hypothetical protein
MRRVGAKAMSGLLRSAATSTPMLWVTRASGLARVKDYSNQARG